VSLELRTHAIAGSAAAARGIGSVDVAKRWSRALAELSAASSDRPEIAESKMYLKQN
jgi:hypothetical protein